MVYMVFLMVSFVLLLLGCWLWKIVLVFSGIVMGLGIWVMYFIGMLGFELFCFISYDFLIMFIFVILAIVVSIYVLNFLSF